MSKETFIAMLGLILGILGLFKIAAVADQGSTQSYTLVDKPPLVDLAPDKIALLTLGFPQVYHQFLNFWAVQFLGDQNIAQESPDQILEVLTAISQHKPKIRDLYQLSCYTFLLDFDNPDYCLNVLVNGMRAVPDDWSIPLLAGIVYKTNKKDLRNATLFFMAAAAKKGAPAYVINVANKRYEESQNSGGFMENDLSDLSEFFDDKKSTPLGGKLKEYFNKKTEENNKAMEQEP